MFGGVECSWALMGFQIIPLVSPLKPSLIEGINNWTVAPSPPAKLRRRLRISFVFCLSISFCFLASSLARAPRVWTRVDQPSHLTELNAKCLTPRRVCWSLCLAVPPIHERLLVTHVGGLLCTNTIRVNFTEKLSKYLNQTSRTQIGTFSCQKEAEGFLMWNSFFSSVDNNLPFH